MGWLSDYAENFVGRLEDSDKGIGMCAPRPDLKPLTGEERERVWKGVQAMLDSGHAVARPTDEHLLADLKRYSVHITKDGRRVDPEEFYMNPLDDGSIERE